jgi:hypothetical protein
MLVSEVGLPTRTQAPVLQPQASAVEAPAPTAQPDANVPATEVATTRAEIEIRLAFEFGVRLSFDSNSAPVGRGDREGINAYEDEHDERGDDRVAKLAKGMTKALGRAIKEGLRSFFGDEDELSKTDRKELKELEHDLKQALKDAYKSNRDDDEMDLLGFATDALSAVQGFTESFGAFYAGVFESGEVAADNGDATSGAPGAVGGPDRSDVPAPFVGVENGPTIVKTVDPTVASAGTQPAAFLPTDPADAPFIPRDDEDHDHDHRGDRSGGFGGLGRFSGVGRFASTQERFDRVSSLLERITAQLQDIVDSLQPNEILDDSASPAAPAVSDPTRDPVVADAIPSVPSIQAQMEFTASFTFEASINLVA